MPADDHLGEQFFHGTRHTLKPGQVMEGGRFTANQGMGQPGEHVYFSARADIAAEFARAGYGPRHNLDAKPRIYQVAPVGEHEVDPDEDPEAKSYRARQVQVIRKMPANELRNRHFVAFGRH